MAETDQLPSSANSPPRAQVLKSADTTPPVGASRVCDTVDYERPTADDPNVRGTVVTGVTTGADGQVVGGWETVTTDFSHFNPPTTETRSVDMREDTPNVTTLTEVGIVRFGDVPPPPTVKTEKNPALAGDIRAAVAAKCFGKPSM